MYQAYTPREPVMSRSWTMYNVPWRLTKNYTRLIDRSPTTFIRSSPDLEVLGRTSILTFCNVLVTIRPLSAENDTKMLNRHVSKTGNLACGSCVNSRAPVVFLSTTRARPHLDSSTSLLSLALFLSVFRFNRKSYSTEMPTPIFITLNSFLFICIALRPSPSGNKPYACGRAHTAIKERAFCGSPILNTATCKIPRF